MKKPVLIGLSLLLYIACFAQEKSKKTIQAIRLEEAPKIDGVLDEAVWKNAPIATNFVQNQPDPGKAPSQKTEVKVLYDDDAIYIGAMCYDDQPEEILKAFSQRDDIGNADMFAVVIDAFLDGVNGVGFIVTASGVQFDTKYSSNGEDNSWNAVWESDVKINDQGWVIEYRIPYSALRIPNKDVQQWYINFGRDIRRIRERSWWSELNPEINGFLNQAGYLNGIENIDPPIRLFFYPYLSGIVENFDGNTSNRLAGGMDIKYGLNDAFTLDMTLIPDFTQVRSDNQVLNLSPFEVRFDENRQFFTEGIELFNKGNLFYSRRIGGTPVGRWDVADQLNDSEEIISNPSETRLLNATKISGRTPSKLGIGLFNAVVGESYATIQDTMSKGERRIKTNPLTNYNIVVLDQAMSNNSFISLINTNVSRAGSFYDANVTGTQFDLRGKKNKFSVSGGGAISQLYYDQEDSDLKETDLGHKYNLRVGKIDGNFNASVEYVVESYNYNPNDLGFLFNPNEKSLNFRASYNIFEPFGPFNRMGTGFWQSYQRLHKPDEYVDFSFEFDAFFIWKNFFANGFWVGGRPNEANDFFEPRTSDLSRKYLMPEYHNYGAWISTDYRKPFAIDLRAAVLNWNKKGRHNYFFVISPRWRVNDRLMLIHEYEIFRKHKDEGYVNNQGDDIFFGIRQFDTHINTFNVNYIFSNTASLTFRARHFWGIAEYEDYKLLGPKGELLETTYTGLDEEGLSLHDRNSNFFTIDMNYRWQFAPGSELNLTWKNSIFTDDPNTKLKFVENLDYMFDQKQSNSLSFKVLYFIDYLYLRKFMNRKKT